MEPIQGYPWKDIAEEYEKDGVKIKIANGTMEVGYDKEEDGEKAKKEGTILTNDCG